VVATGCQTIDAFLREASHLANDNIFLKMDIEGAEYEVIPSMTRDTLAHFDQIALELHWLTRLNEDELYHRLMSMFESAPANAPSPTFRMSRTQFGVNFCSPRQPKYVLWDAEQGENLAL
jgi:Methyltransferase FkbM domain